jgi:hypothetical protein
MLTTLALVASLSLPLGSAGSGGAHLLSDTLAPADLFRPTPAAVSLLAPVHASTGATAPDAEPQLVEYSDAYFTRLTIHKWASYLTLPLFVGQYIVGQKLMNGGSTENLRGIHGALGAGIGGLFVVNTVTGGLNMIEARKDPADRNRRTLHSALMLLADAGFVATGLLAKENENEGGFYSGPANNNTHRNVALASMATALVSYAIMLPPFRRD